MRRNSQTKLVCLYEEVQWQVNGKHRSRIRYLSKKIANFNEFSKLKKFVNIRTKIR